MSDGVDGNFGSFTLFGVLSKYIAAVLAVLYIVGFFVVSSHLSKYGVASFSIIQLQYLISGSWTLVPPVLTTLFTDARSEFEERVHLDSGKWSWRRFWLAIFWTEVPFGFLLAAETGAGFLWGLTWRTGIKFLLWSILIGIVGRMLIKCWTVPADKETRYTNRVAVPFYITFLIAITFGYSIWFGNNVYSLIPYSLGGGRPLKVVFLPTEKGLPGVLKPDGKGRSVPYELLTETDKVYVVISQEPPEKSLEFVRESVEGMIVISQ